MAKKAKRKKFLQNLQDKRTVARQLKQRRKTTMTTKDHDEKKAKHDEEQRAKKDGSEQRAKQRAADQDPVTEQVHQNTDKSAEELMSTPEVSPAPNPPSPPGGEMIGEPTVLVPHSEPEEQSLQEQRPTNPGPGERQRLTDEDRQR